jgi:hypothetical protein
MVTQMFLLAFAHEHQSLAQAITRAFDEILRETGIDTREGLDYVSVLGVITACQQQTTLFPWADFLERTETKIYEAVRNGQPCKRHAKKKKNAV